MNTVFAINAQVAPLRSYPVLHWKSHVPAEHVGFAFAGALVHFGVPVHTSPEQASLIVHASPSVHGSPSMPHAAAVSHASFWQVLPAPHVIGADQSRHGSLSNWPHVRIVVAP